MATKSETLKSIDFRSISTNYGLRHRVLEDGSFVTIEFVYKSASVVVGVGTTSDSDTPWATAYSIDYDDKHAAIHLLKSLNHYFRDFAFSLAETMDVKSILYQSGVKEREQGELTTTPGV